MIYLLINSNLVIIFIKIKSPKINILFLETTQNQIFIRHLTLGCHQKALSGGSTHPDIQNLQLGYLIFEASAVGGIYCGRVQQLRSSPLFCRQAIPFRACDRLVVQLSPTGCQNEVLLKNRIEILGLRSLE